MTAARKDRFGSGIFGKPEDIKEIKQVTAAIESHIDKVNGIIEMVNVFIKWHKISHEQQNQGSPDIERMYEVIPLLDSQVFLRDTLMNRLKILESQREIKNTLTKALKTRDIATLKSAIDDAEEALSKSQNIMWSWQEFMRSMGIFPEANDAGSLSKSMPSSTTNKGTSEMFQATGAIGVSGSDPSEDTAEMMLIRWKAWLSTEEINLE